MSRRPADAHLLVWLQVRLPGGIPPSLSRLPSIACMLRILFGYNLPPPPRSIAGNTTSKPQVSTR
ncbi:hypothetical protein LZ30DRAFT_733856 [Colletotrichum cereale]|nr:hypothetical protein LZ30DRAFT_733856 [Colletotrichum cereale]